MLTILVANIIVRTFATKYKLILFISMDNKGYITENKVLVDKQGKIMFFLTEETKKLGHVSIEEGKILGHQVIDALLKANGIQG